MTRVAERLFALVRATLRNRMDDASLFEGTDAAQWREIYDLSSVQGVLAQAWDGMQLLPEAMRPPRALRLQWAVNVERIEKVYRQNSGRSWPGSMIKSRLSANTRGPLIKSGCGARSAITSGPLRPRPCAGVRDAPAVPAG